MFSTTKYIFWFSLLLVCLCVHATQIPHKFGGRDEVHDKEHLKQHLDQKIDVDSAKWDATQERFHYFSMHDLNKDNMIDGIEVIKALTHSHDGGPASEMSEAQIEQMVDLVFKDIDVNDDGFIDYAEYSKRAGF